MFALVFEAAGDCSSCRIGFAKGIRERLSCLSERKTGIQGVEMQRGVGTGSGCAPRVRRAEDAPGGWGAPLPTHSWGVWALKCCSWASWARPALGWEVGWEPSTASHSGCANPWSGSARVGRIWGWAGLQEGQDTRTDTSPVQWWLLLVQVCPWLPVELSEYHTGHPLLCLCLLNSWTQGTPKPALCTESIPELSRENSTHVRKLHNFTQFYLCVFLVIARNSEKWLRMGAAQTGIAAFQLNMVSSPGELEFLLPGDVAVIFP